MDILIYYLYYIFTMDSRQVSFLHGMHMPRCAAVVDKYFDGYHSLQLMTAGRVLLRYDSEEFSLDGAWLWPAGDTGQHIYFTHQHPARYWNHRYIAVRGALLDRWIADGLWPATAQPMPQIADFVERFDRLLACAFNPGRVSSLRAVNILESLLIDMLEDRTETSPAAEAWLATVLAALEDASVGNVDYAALAESVGMSLSTLRRRFRQRMHTPLHSYALQLRIGSARKLLADSDEPIKFIASRLGYSDVYFFSRQFKSLSGISPAEFRKSAR